MRERAPGPSHPPENAGVLVRGPARLAINDRLGVPFVEASGEVPRGEKMLYSGADPELYITEYILAYEDKLSDKGGPCGRRRARARKVDRW